MKKRLVYSLSFIPLVILQILWTLPGIMIGFIGSLIITSCFASYAYLKYGKKWYEHYSANDDDDFYDYEGWFLTFFYYISCWPVVIILMLRDECDE